MPDRKPPTSIMKLDMEQVTRTESILNQNQVQKLWNATPKRYKFDRPAKGGGKWTYVTTHYTRQVLDSVFGFNWSFDIETSLAEAFEIAKLTKVCVVKGAITAKVKDRHGNWHELRKTQFGRKEVAFKRDSTEPLDFGNDMKSAASDALKKCASMFGIAADVYDPTEFMEIEIIGSDKASERDKQLAKLTESAKAALKAQAEEVGGENE